MTVPSDRSANSCLWTIVFALCFWALALAAEDFKKTALGSNAVVEAAGVTEDSSASPKMDSEAKVLLEKMETAYDNIKSAKFSGQVDVNVDIPSDAHQTNQQFTSSFSAPNKFKHQAKDGLLLASNGGEVYVFNEDSNSYLSIDLPTRKVEMRSLPIIVPQVLQSQNPSLLFAMSKNGLREVAESFDEIRKGAGEDIGGTNYPELVFCSDQQESELHILVNPQTHMIRRFTIDFKPALYKGGITNVQNAEVVVDYTESDAKAEFPETYFAWTPPEGAFNVREAAGAARPEKTKSNLQGVPAPAFRLPTLDGRSAALDHFKGKVVVLEFWATWSPTSPRSLSAMADLGEAHEKDLKVFAINLEEDKEKVKTFVDLKGIDVPVLLDADGTVAKAYEVKTIPQTVVIGKDGIVQKVFAGESEDRDQKIEDAIEAARSGK